MENTIIKLNNDLSFDYLSQNRKRVTSFLINEIFKKKRYYKKGFEINQNDTIIDIGANMGLFILWIAPQAMKGKIIAIEPSSSFKILEHNIKLNNLNNVKIINAAICYKNKEIEIINYPKFNIICHAIDLKPSIITKSLINLRFIFNNQKPIIEKAKCISLEQIIEINKINKIDFLKIDCEGSEYNILRNLPKKYFKIINKIAMEFHEFAIDQKHVELKNILQNNGFKVIIEKNLFEYYCLKYGFIWASK